MTATAATATVEVPVDPDTAFWIFTEEIDLWWVRGPINFFDAARATAMHIEPHLDGRILEVYALPDDVLELGRITAWSPGNHFTYRSSVDDTQTHITFTPTDSGTEVTVVQSLVQDGAKAFYFWPNVISWFPAWLSRRDTAPSTPREADRLAIALYYEDPAAAARWLHTAYGLDSWSTIPAEGSSPSWIELNVGTRAILLFPRTAPNPPQNDHSTWIFVDDLDAHFAQATAAGAKILTPIHQHGYRRYETQDLEGHHWTFAQARPTQ
ncbi:bleomycin resistance protein [Kribbella sandramycini]|uniref:Bleomycin resistance protein n=1 Tax=Kribbella sandramycini TaxID=60450 RepID=A0A7Y4L5X6_9ACTN|nr:VOC family protein [Kribbella sandramycini]MBB6567176.1 putative glyoxalase superfamily protein PhnB [Kribbella sandramycini]NOL44893.1 bleomycin resistance protein [Kribbella sandramycini]